MQGTSTPSDVTYKSSACIDRRTFGFNEGNSLSWGCKVFHFMALVLTFFETPSGHRQTHLLDQPWESNIRSLEDKEKKNNNKLKVRWFVRCESFFLKKTSHEKKNHDDQSKKWHGHKWNWKLARKIAKGDAGDDGKAAGPAEQVGRQLLNSMWL